MKPTVPRRKVELWLTPEAFDALEQLAAEWNLTRMAVVETIVRREKGLRPFRRAKRKTATCVECGDEVTGDPKYAPEVCDRCVEAAEKTTGPVHIPSDPGPPVRGEAEINGPVVRVRPDEERRHRELPDGTGEFLSSAVPAPLQPVVREWTDPGAPLWVFQAGQGLYDGDDVTPARLEALKQWRRGVDVEEPE